MSFGETDVNNYWMAGRGETPPNNLCGRLSHGLLPSVVDDDNGFESRARQKFIKFLPTARRSQMRIADLSWLSRGETDFARTLVGRAGR